MSEKMARGHYLKVVRGVKKRKRRRLERELQAVNEEIRGIEEALAKMRDEGGGKDE